MDQPSKRSVAVRLGAFFFILLDAALAALNCFNAHSAISIATEDLLSGNNHHQILASQVQNFTRLGVSEATIITAIVCSIHAVAGVLFICYSRCNTLWIFYVSIQFVLAMTLLCIGGTMAVRIPAFRPLFEMYHGRYSNLYYYTMYYGSIAEGVYGGLWIAVPCTTLAALWAWA